MPFALVGIANDGASARISTASSDIDKKPIQPSIRPTRAASSSLVRRLDLALLQSHQSSANYLEPGNQATSRMTKKQSGGSTPPITADDPSDRSQSARVYTKQNL